MTRAQIRKRWNEASRRKKQLIRTLGHAPDCSTRGKYYSFERSPRAYGRWAEEPSGYRHNGIWKHL